MGRTVVEPGTMLQIPRPIYVGQIGEMHYVATFITDGNSVKKDSEKLNYSIAKNKR